MYEQIATGIYIASCEREEKKLSRRRRQMSLIKLGVASYALPFFFCFEKMS